MTKVYQAFETLRQHKAVLHDSVELGSGIQLAAWSNKNDIVNQESADHHTRSLYVADGYECYHKTRGGWRNGGGPDRFCLMPKGSMSSWDAARRHYRLIFIPRKTLLPVCLIPVLI